jgi:hypothetical protein
VDYLGIEKMLMIVCRSEEGMKYLHSIDPTGGEDEDFSTLHSFARSRNRSIKGRFRVLILDEARYTSSGFKNWVFKVDVCYFDTFLSAPNSQTI